MRKVPIILGVLLLMGSWNAVAVRAQAEHVYLVKVFKCAHEPAERTQTGFRVSGLNGVITALHGIVDCPEIRVQSKKGLLLFEPLKIASVDIDHDLATITSQELGRKDLEGLEPARDIQWASLRSVKVFGHPYGIAALETTLNIRNPPLTGLKDLLPPLDLEQIRLRGSPNHLIRVLNLQGTLLPGDSGAPILDSANRVIAIANGGLREGFSQICWAVPFQDIEWEDVKSNSRLKKLEKSDVATLFAFETKTVTTVAEAKDADDEFCTAARQVHHASYDGFISIIGKPVLSTLPGYFVSKINLPGSSNSTIVPREYAIFEMARSKQLGDVESSYYELVSRLRKCLSGWEERGGEFHTIVLTVWREKKDSPEIKVQYDQKEAMTGEGYKVSIWFMMEDIDFQLKLSRAFVLNTRPQPILKGAPMEVAR
jgi:hypothetical protein